MSIDEISRYVGGYCWTVLSIIAVLCVLVFSVYLFIPLKDFFIGVPMVEYKEPDWSDQSSFYAKMTVPCNRLYTRELGFEIDPPVPVDSIKYAEESITGDVSVYIYQNGVEIKEDLDLRSTGWAWSGGGVWLKPVYRFSPLGSFFCNQQEIVIEASGMNIDLRKHKLMVYVSRDRRP